MRRILAAAGALSLSVLALTACSTGSSSAAPCARDLPASSALDLVDVSDTAVGTRPDISLTAPVHVGSASVEDRIVGDGEAVTSDTQDVVFDLTVIDGSSGTTVAASGYTGDLSQVYPVDSWQETFPGLVDALDCATEGSRIVMALGPDDVAADTRSRFGIGEDASTVVVLDLQKVYLAAADGAEVLTGTPFQSMRNTSAVIIRHRSSSVNLPPSSKLSSSSESTNCVCSMLTPDPSTRPSPSRSHRPGSKPTCGLPRRNPCDQEAYNSVPSFGL